MLKHDDVRRPSAAFVVAVIGVTVAVVCRLLATEQLEIAGPVERLPIVYTVYDPVLLAVSVTGAALALIAGTVWLLAVSYQRHIPKIGSLDNKENTEPGIRASAHTSR